MPQHHASPSIGMFDSGIGGLTVMKQIMKNLPKESIVYLGDTARVPYGNKSRETIIRYSIENVIFLMEHNIKILVVPCNTASAYALERLQQIFNIPIIGVIEAGAERAAHVTRNGHIAILGTKGTVQSEMYQKAIQRIAPKATVTAIACPLFVPLVEEAFCSHTIAEMIVREYLAPLKAQKIDTLVLGCTHYPLLYTWIEKEMGPHVTIVDSAIPCAEKVAHILQKNSWQTTSQIAPSHKYFVSDDPEKFRALGQTFLGCPIPYVEAIPPR
jgi:glutamate racemase